MCGGAIISDFIPSSRSRRPSAADFLWPDPKWPASGKGFSKPPRSDIVDVDDGFEADFLGFKDESDVEEDLDVKPFAFSATSKPRHPKAKSNLGKQIPKVNMENVQPNMSQDLSNLMNGFDDDFLNSVDFIEEKPSMNQISYMGSFNPSGAEVVKSLLPVGNAPLCFTSDQGSNSLDCSDYGWGDNGPKTPDVTSFLSAALGVEESPLEEANPTKKLKPNPQEVMANQETAPKTLSDELSMFDSQVFFQMPFLEGVWDAPIETLFNGDMTQDGGNSVDLWTFDEVPSMSGGVF
ncbi:hypothetical protein SAY86_031206 [Trapa natans]|uniref:Uncharacterized protein n=1 Tax=Trapa natans TaxID=22666 RepID=A0AAN7M306_TRANT|nr:hypothetical protein SAY86_031206 [Trapa natans]